SDGQHSPSKPPQSTTVCSGLFSVLPISYLSLSFFPARLLFPATRTRGAAEEGGSSNGSNTLHPLPLLLLQALLRSLRPPPPHSYSPQVPLPRPRSLPPALQTGLLPSLAARRRRRAPARGETRRGHQQADPRGRQVPRGLPSGPPRHLRRLFRPGRRRPRRGIRRRWGGRRRRGCGGEDGVRRRHRGRAEQRQDRDHQGHPGADEPSAQGGEGADRGAAEEVQGGCLEGGGRGSQEAARRGRRQDRDRKFSEEWKQQR
ncbi:hypothetical protein Taro_008210, partial [Colocasia esculenta]|nr:hypothetical protein [Colocasia esculenta]